MLLNTMNDNEILNEIKRDYTSCKEKIKYYHNKFNNSVRNKLFMTTDSYKMVTPNGNEWFTFYYGNMLNKYYKHYVFMRNMDGSYKVLSINIQNNDVYGITIFSAHFFDRYRERYHKNRPIPFKTLFYDFLSKNPIFLSIGTDEGNYTIMREGIGLVEFSSIKNVCYVNTFITRDMLKSDQKELLGNYLDMLK